MSNFQLAKKWIASDMKASLLKLDVKVSGYANRMQLDASTLAVFTFTPPVIPTQCSLVFTASLFSICVRGFKHVTF